MDSMVHVTVHVKLPSGRVISVTAHQTERVGDLTARVVATAVDDSSTSATAGSATADLGLGAARLIFAGRALNPETALASYSVENESELHLVIRPAASAAAADPWAELRAAVAQAQLQDFDGFQKVGGRDITAVAGVGYTQHGVCSYVYKAHIRGGDTGTPLAIKVMHNMDVTMHQTVAIAQTFRAEQELLSDIKRLPPHPNIMAVLRAFTDDASSLPGWDFDLDIVQPRTMMVVMPFVPKDLLNLLGAARRAGQPIFGEARAARLGGQVAHALAHLEAHAIVHRDVKLDNILVDAAGSADERAVLTDFGHCFDLRKNRVADARVAMLYDGFCRGGAQIALAPEVLLPQPGPGVHLYYGRNDAWALGMVCHELLSSPGHAPFEQMEHPETYSDADFRPVDQELVPSLVDAVNGLLRLDPSERLSAAKAAVLLEAVDAEIAARVEMQRLAEEEARRVEEETRRAEEEARRAEQLHMMEVRMSKARAVVESQASQQRVADQEVRDAEQALEVLTAVLAAARAEVESAAASMSSGLHQLSVAQHAARCAAAAVESGPQLICAAEAGEDELAAALATTFDSERVPDEQMSAAAANVRAPTRIHRRMPVLSGGRAQLRAAEAALRDARQRAEAAARGPEALGREDKEMPAGTVVHVTGRGDGALGY
jgi:hypothetical protein